MKAQSTFSLKDQLFNAEKVSYLANLIAQVDSNFQVSAFESDVVQAFPQLELKERIAHITACLHRYLPQDYPAAIAILLAALPPPLDPSKSDYDFGDFIFAPLSLFAATYGCCREHLEISLEAIRQITQRFSAEYAIRFFINAFPAETLAFLSDCAADEHYHVRRLASEGTRPKLPWAQKLNIGYQRPLPILEQLFSDPTRFVTRSVANHLNDISKLDPPFVIDTLARWASRDRQDPKEMAFITKHALRSLVKQGNPAALALLGFGANPDVKIHRLQTSQPTVRIGEAFEFSFEIEAMQPQNLMVDYVMQFASEGKVRSQKVFKIKQLSLQAGEVVQLKKRHPMRLMTTRRLALGTHKVTLQINGKAFGALAFELVS